ncbi:MAG: 3-oxoacyl-ACP reductase FabG [marine benthic group bacterium]|nr:3-oxoacyl-ACP reductase FabG [Candidatus Carthagonibacter metallireducens]MCL7964381.1 3-oxoacyl-ACP reductase FabG [Gemmatimonadota bacterium]MCL7967928.1 3-oxoacyl-ACP reductase FabG [Gemmatimonadota bacterium]MCL7969365.1 3-oxoacyl-ACP reductase FabG [Gemmatimonadota bacterium]MCL7976659.1 3-oxoacyl-ACP reductase FabG [Gemmatimonadota bacterium]
MTELDGQVAIVSGASRGIGEAIARSLSEAGCSVACVARDAARAAAVADTLESEGRGYACDVSDPAACADLVAAVDGELGPVDILVNNAGITRDNVLVRLKDEDWQTVMDTNLRGAFNTTRAVARGMMKRRAGRIINIASVVGLTGNRGQANYAASKAGLVGFSKSVALELASRGVLVNVVAPGFIETDMTSDLPEEARVALFERIPLGRLGRPEDVAGVVRFLAGPAAAYMTGQVLVVDGGMVMNG